MFHHLRSHVQRHQLVLTTPIPSMGRVYIYLHEWLKISWYSCWYTYTMEINVGLPWCFFFQGHRFLGDVPSWRWGGTCVEDWIRSLARFPCGGGRHHPRWVKKGRCAKGGGKRPVKEGSGTEVYKIFIYIHLKKHPCFLKINISYPYYEGHATIKIISESSDLLWKATR